jgi:hypothetical protein
VTATLELLGTQGTWLDHSDPEYQENGSKAHAVSTHKRAKGMGTQTRTYNLIEAPGVPGRDDVAGRDDPVFVPSTVSGFIISSVGGWDAPTPGAARECRRRR